MKRLRRNFDDDGDGDIADQVTTATTTTETTFHIQN